MPRPTRRARRAPRPAAPLLALPLLLLPACSGCPGGAPSGPPEAGVREGGPRLPPRPDAGPRYVDDPTPPPAYCEPDPDEPALCHSGWADCHCLDPRPGDRDGDGVPDEADCAPDRNWIYPDAGEIPCNGVDEDCDGRDRCEPADIDSDGDGVPDEADCAPFDPDIGPNAEEILCNGIDEDCESGPECCADEDGDGQRWCWNEERGRDAGWGDCDDTDPSIPGAEIPCDGIDQDCDGHDCCDNDEDGDGSPCRLDCDDTDPNVYPGRKVDPALHCYCRDINCDGDASDPGEFGDCCL